MVCLGRSVFSPGSNPWRWWCSVLSNSHGAVAWSVSAQEYSGTSCFYEAGQPAFCRTDSFSIQGWSVLTPLSVGNNFLWLLRSSRGIILAHLRRPPCSAPPPPEAELFERTQANLRPPFPKLRLRDRRNATPSPSSGPHNHKRSWITDATPAHGSFSMILAVPSPWGYAPALLTSDLATSSQR